MSRPRARGQAGAHTGAQTHARDTEKTIEGIVARLAEKGGGNWVDATASFVAPEWHAGVQKDLEAGLRAGLGSRLGARVVGAADSIGAKLHAVRENATPRAAKVAKDAVRGAAKAGDMAGEVAETLFEWIDLLAKPAVRLCARGVSDASIESETLRREGQGDAAYACAREELEMLFYDRNTQFVKHRDLGRKCEGRWVNMGDFGDQLGGVYGEDPEGLGAQRRSFEVFTMQSSVDSDSYYCMHTDGIYEYLVARVRAVSRGRVDVARDLNPYTDDGWAQFEGAIPNPAHLAQARDPLNLPEVHMTLTVGDMRRVVLWKRMVDDIHELLLSGELSALDVMAVGRFSESIAPTRDITGGDRSWWGTVKQSAQSTVNTAWSFSQAVPGVAAATRWTRRMLTSPSDFLIVYTLMSIVRTFVCVVLHLKTLGKGVSEGAMDASTRQLVYSLVFGRFFENILASLSSAWRIFKGSFDIAFCDTRVSHSANWKCRITTGVADWLAQVTPASGYVSQFVAFLINNVLGLVTVLERQVFAQTLGYMQMFAAANRYWSTMWGVVGAGTVLASGLASGGATWMAMAGMGLGAGATGLKWFNAEASKGDALNLVMGGLMAPLELILTLTHEYLAYLNIPFATDAYRNPGSLSGLITVFAPQMVCKSMGALVFLLARAFGPLGGLVRGAFAAYEKTALHRFICGTFARFWSWFMSRAMLVDMVLEISANLVLLAGVDSDTARGWSSCSKLSAAAKGAEARAKATSWNEAMSEATQKIHGATRGDLTKPIDQQFFHLEDKVCEKGMPAGQCLAKFKQNRRAAIGEAIRVDSEAMGLPGAASKLPFLTRESADFARMPVQEMDASVRPSPLHVIGQGSQPSGVSWEYIEEQKSHARKMSTADPMEAYTRGIEGFVGAVTGWDFGNT